MKLNSTHIAITVKDLRDLIIRGQASPSQIASHELPRPRRRAYDQFGKRADGWIKVIRHPGKNA